MKPNLFVITILLSVLCINAQNLVVDGALANSNVNWNAQEAPFNATTYESTYLAGGCVNNYVMEVDNASSPRQTINNFKAALTYVLTFRAAYRTSCAPVTLPAGGGINLQFQFTDATGVLTYSVNVPTTQTTLTATSFTFTNNAATTHTLSITTLNVTGTCGVIVDDITIEKYGTPGGIPAASMTLWLKASTIALADNASVFSWVAQGTSGVALRSPCAEPAVYKTGLSGTDFRTANYNPYVTFNGTTQYLEYTTARLNLMALQTAAVGGSLFDVHMGGATGTCVFGHRGTTLSRAWIRATGTACFADNSATGTNNQGTYANSNRVNIIGVNGKHDGLVVRDQNGTSIAVANGAATTDYLTIGVRRFDTGTYSQFFGGNVSEVIVFNSILTNIQMQQVRSYLALKYGVTLSNNSTTGGIDERDYIASDAMTNIWSFTANSTYHNNVTIIGRDDNSSLDQRTSTSTDADATTNSGNAMLTISTATAFAGDQSFFAAGHNGISALNSASNNITNVPPTIQARMSRFWKFQTTGATVPANVTVTFDMTGFTPLTGSDLRLLVSTTSSFSSASIITGAYAAPNFTATLPTTGGVFFTVGSINSTNTPLPVELLYFNALSQNNSSILCKWATATETNNDYFTVEHSKDGVTFEEVGVVDGSGNSNTKKEYLLTNVKPHFGISYYRLKQTDYNHAFAYSNIVSVDLKPEKKILAHPNPVLSGSEIDVFVYGYKNQLIKLTFYDASGKLIEYLTVEIEEDEFEIAVNFVKQLQSGAYFIIIEDQKGGKVSQKIIVY